MEAKLSIWSQYYHEMKIEDAVLEFIKNDQELFEANHLLNMGQLLSLPFVIWGIYLIIRAYKRPALP